MRLRLRRRQPDGRVCGPLACSWPGRPIEAMSEADFHAMRGPLLDPVDMPGPLAERLQHALERQAKAGMSDELHGLLAELRQRLYPSSGAGTPSH